MALKYKQMKVRIHGISPLLGSVASSKDIYTEYIATKAKTDEEKARAAEDADYVEGVEKSTGFYKDPVTGYPVLAAYQFKGFLKAAAKTLASQLDINSTTSKVDNLIFIRERYIPLMREDGTVIKEPDGFLERPLRAETMQGPRVGLAKSECINEGWMCEFTLLLFDNKATSKSKEITLDMIKDMISYGEFKGLLQWRNGGNGSFTFEVIEEQ